MEKLAIGTANFGMNYGSVNSGQKLNQDMVTELLDYAWSNDIKTIDTAEAYGESETVIGNYLKKNIEKNFDIITKIISTENPLKQLNQSLVYLHRPKIHGVLIHNFESFKNDHTLYNQLLEFKKSGSCNKVGFSLYYPEELQFLIDNNVPFDILQIAFSLFDRRFESFFQTLNELGVEIHVRSVFLQGLFFADTNKLSPHFDKIKLKIEKIKRLSDSTGLSIASICLNFVNSNDHIHKIIIGVENMDNLKKNIQVLSEKEMIVPHIESLKDLSEKDLNILFPHYWKT